MASLTVYKFLITHVTKTTQPFGQNEFIAQCENCLTKYWTINKNATKKKKLIKIHCLRVGVVGRDYASSPDLTKDETLGHALDYKGNSISLSLVN